MMIDPDHRVYYDRKGRQWTRQWGNMFASELGRALRHIDDIKW